MVVVAGGRHPSDDMWTRVLAARTPRSPKVVMLVVLVAVVIVAAARADAAAAAEIQSVARRATRPDAVEGDCPDHKASSKACRSEVCLQGEGGWTS